MTSHGQVHADRSCLGWAFGTSLCGQGLTLYAESVDDRLLMAEAVAYLEEARRRWADTGLDTLADVAAALEPAWALDRDRMRPDPRRQFSIADRVRDLIARLGAMDAVTMAERLEVPVNRIAAAALGNLQAHRLHEFMDACDLDVSAVAELWHVTEHDVRGWLEGDVPDQMHATSTPRQTPSGCSSPTCRS